MGEADINQVVRALEEFLAGYQGAGGTAAKEVRVRPSGDDYDVVKVWVDLGPGVDDEACVAWARQCERDGAELATGFTLQVRAESL